MTDLVIDAVPASPRQRVLQGMPWGLLGVIAAACAGLLLLAAWQERDDLARLAGDVRSIDGPLELRSQPATIALGDGTVMVWGGRNISTDSGNVFDPATGAWEHLPAAPGPPRFGAAAVWTGAEAVIWGGSTKTASFTLDAGGIAWNPRTRQWRELPPAPVALMHARAAAIDGGVLFAGGNTLRSPQDPVALWHDLDSGTWTVVPTPFMVLSTASSGDRLLATGPRTLDEGQRPDQEWPVMQFDPATLAWTQVAPPLTAGWAALAVAADGTLTAVTTTGLNEPLRAWALEDGRWRQAAETITGQSPVSTIEIVGYPPAAAWTGRHLVLGASGGLVAWDPDQQTFAARFDRAIRTFGADIVWTGEHIVSLTNQSSKGWIWTPPRASGGE